MTRPLTIIIGATGLLGPYLMESFSARGRALGAARKNADIVLDLLNPDKAARIISGYDPDTVVLAAAFTNVDGCEADPAKAMALNREPAAALARTLPPRTKLLYVSSDQVYPDLPGPHREEDEGPVNLYGQSKLAGEKQALARPGSLALRVNFFGPSRTPGRTSLSDFVINSLEQGRSITLFTDLLFSPLHMDTLSRLMARAVEKNLSGVYNLGSRQGMSKRDFGLLIAAHKKLSAETAKSGVSTQAMPGRAIRPKDMRLDVNRFEQATGITLPPLAREIEKL